MAEKKLWGGRFDQPTDALMEEFSESVSFDQAMAMEDIAGSAAHARMLAEQGVISKQDMGDILRGLDQVQQEIAAGAFLWRTDREDVHMNIEARLTELVGEAGKKLHTGRSRNDQVALDFRLLVHGRLFAWQEGARLLAQALADQAEQHVDTLLPGCTHLQPAQPVTLGHHLLAYCWMLQRDCERMEDCQKRTAVSPLGAAALAGTTYPLNPSAVAKELGFPQVFANSMDAVSDRDFALEALFSASTVMVHLSRLCEELILWSAPAYGFVKLPDAFATGSSIMPQKKNPDAAEITRGKTGRVFGSLMALLTTMKGLPMAYNRDLQEDKEPFLDADKTVSACLAVMAAMVLGLEFLPHRMEAALKAGFLNATELADYLASRNIPFREAHELTGRAVAAAEAQSKGLEDMSLEELQAIAPQVQEDVFQVLDYRAAVERRTTPGSTSPASVREQLAKLRVWLGDKT